MAVTGAVAVAWYGEPEGHGGEPGFAWTGTGEPERPEPVSSLSGV